MELLAVFDKPSVIDRYTFVFDEMNPGGFNTMLGMSEDGHTFSQWTSGIFEPEGDNEHLGQRITLQQLGETALNAFFSRIAINRYEE